MSPVHINDRAAAAPATVPTLANNYATAPVAVDPTAERRPVEPITVDSPNLTYTDDAMFAKYVFHGTHVKQEGVRYSVKPTEKKFEFKTERNVPKTGLMLVGWGGNNGTTLTATILANKQNLSWSTRDGTQNSNYLGSLVRASTLRLGTDDTGKDVHIPFSDVLPMVHPNDLVVRDSSLLSHADPVSSEVGTSRVCPSTALCAVPRCSSTTSSARSRPSWSRSCPSRRCTTPSSSTRTRPSARTT